MILLQKIEINYLRSLYSATLDDVGDLNIVFGRNDSGKSNLLRALNLFFNGKVDPGTWLDFELDMSDRRKQEARDAKGRQFIWIKVTFRVPENYRNSLGDVISVKKQWNRDGDVSQTVFPSLDTAGKQARLTRLLNEINFSYIPAIKDMNVYADLIERMYGAAAETTTLREATNRFVDAIEGQTTSLSEQLAKLFGAPARLAPPTEMSKLFRSLDFSHGEDRHSLLRQKGDGVKARHLPEILRFINENELKKRFYLWGFEEPENSLDLGAAEAEARRFAKFSERFDTQIFITSHSPAFYLSSAENSSTIRRFFITKQIKSTGDEMLPKNAASLIDKLEDAEAKMEQAGLLQLPFVIRQMGEQRRALQDQQQEAEKLRKKLSELQQPTLFVEGKHDVEMFDLSLKRLGKDASIALKPLGGTPQSVDALLSSVIEQGGINSSSLAFFLFDDDKAGRGAYRKLCKGTPGQEPSKIQDRAFAWTIPWTETFKKFARKNNITREQAFFTGEFLYPAEEAAEICLELINALGRNKFSDWFSTINGDYWPHLGQKKCYELLQAKEGSVDWFYARGVPDSLKGQFANKAREQGLSTEYIDEITGKILGQITQQS